MATTKLDISEATLAKLIGTTDAAELMAELEAYDAQCKANKPAAQEATTELGILPIHPLASPFERKHRARQEQANGFNASSIWDMPAIADIGQHMSKRVRTSLSLR